MNFAAFRRTRLALAMGAAMLSLSAGHALGSSFALQEQNGSGVGNAFAGGAAVAEDASTIYFNPAGMSRLPGVQGVVSGDLICLSAKLSDNGSQPAALQPLGGTGGDAGSCAVVPSLYLAVPINKQWAFGLGVGAPFGLKTEYDSEWLGRFQAIKSKVDTININPAVSWKVTDMVTVGAGANWQRIKATLTNDVNYSGALATAAAAAAAGGLIPPAVIPPLLAGVAGLESPAAVNGNDSAWGWNIGILVEPDKWTRIGASYRSRISYTIRGQVNFNNPALPALTPPLDSIGALLATGVNQVLSNGDVTLALKVPDTGNISFFRTLNDKWDLMADIQYTGWSSIQNLTIVRSTGAILSVTPENFRDTWRGSIGTNYHYTNQWMFRAGLAYDQSPIRDAQRTPTLPDNDRTWLAIGAQYRVSPQLALDAGYTHIFVRNPSINQNQGSTAANGLISGSYKNDVNVVGLQATYTFN
ncbi:MAG TPA: outer membrane protein transport protein [Casimicrobiaceae bacterium]|nr:outer membrane protein transport protein [Casimicrobiaceae bacterium]